MWRGAAPRPPGKRTCRYHLLHGDLNPANVLVADGRLAGIIDWSYARCGDPLFDCARLRMNPFARCSAEATATYFALLRLSGEERAREDFSFRFNLVEYVQWYAQSGSADRVREHLALLDRALRSG
jgi:aminoglycoside phosphotransferase (APT) family kinase protein